MIDRIVRYAELLRDIFDFIASFGKIYVYCEPRKIEIKVGNKFNIEISSEDVELITLIKTTLRKICERL